jgi:hypothetical protein
MGLRATLETTNAILRDRVESLGHAGTIGVALIIFAIAFAFGGVQPLREEVQALRSKEQRLSRLPEKIATNAPEQRKIAVKALDLPSAADALPQVMRLSDLAESQGLKLRSGDYRLHRDRDAGVSAYQMHYPVTGSYTALRRFINQALEEFPALALEEVLIRRNTIGADLVEAKLRFTLYLREK